MSDSSPENYLSDTCGDGYSCIPLDSESGVCVEWFGGQDVGDLCVSDDECGPGMGCVYEDQLATAGWCRALCGPNCGTLDCSVGLSCVELIDEFGIGVCLDRPEESE